MTEAGARAPKYHRLADRLRREIREGHYQPGERLPTEAALAKQYRVSPPVVRQALALLRAEGLIETRHGVGTFVKQERRLQRRSRRRYGRARADEQLLTSHLTHEIVSARREPVPGPVAGLLGMDAGAVVVVRRRRLRDDTGRVVEVGASYLPVEVAGGTYLEDPVVVPKALFLCVEELTGHRYTSARDHWIARLPTAEEADTLDLPTGAPVLHVLHAAYAEDSTPLEVSESTWPADDVMLIDEYPIDQEPTIDDDRSDI